MDFRTWLRPPSQPSIQRPRNAFDPPGVSTAAVTPGLILRDTCHAMLHQHLAIGQGCEQVEQDVTDLVLLQHQPERVRRVVASAPRSKSATTPERRSRYW